MAVRQRQSRATDDKADKAHRSLNLETVPSGATVTEADNVLGNTPLTITFTEQGTRTFQLALAGHRRVKYKVDPRTLASEGGVITRTLNLTAVDGADQAEEEMVFGVVDRANAKKPAAAREGQGVKKKASPASGKVPGRGQAQPKKARKIQKKPQARPLPRRDSKVIAPRLPQRRRPAERPRRVVRPKPRAKPKAAPRKADELVNPFD